MFNALKALAAVAALVAVAGCANNTDDVEEFVIADPVTVEPAFNGKYN